MATTYHFRLGPDVTARTNFFAFEKTNSQSNQIRGNGNRLLKVINLLAFTDR